jgi:hypothetical protein
MEISAGRGGLDNHPFREVTGYRLGQLPDFVGTDNRCRQGSTGANLGRQGIRPRGAEARIDWARIGHGHICFLIGWGGQSVVIARGGTGFLINYHSLLFPTHHPIP